MHVARFLRTMIGRRIAIARVFGIDIRIDAGCIAVSILVAWTLATGLFPQRYLGLSTATLWMMGIAGSLGLFVSIVLHELGHAIVARRRGIGIDGITLFIFGGVAEMEDEPRTPRAELDMAAAGPLMSVLLAVFFYALALTRNLIPWPTPVLALVEYLAVMNAILAVFNLVPAFPLDGGRILRAILWRKTQSLPEATRVATRCSAVFAYLFMALGVVDASRGEIASAIWWAMIGIFVRVVAETSYRQLLARFAVERGPGD